MQVKKIFIHLFKMYTLILLRFIMLLGLKHLSSQIKMTKEAYHQTFSKWRELLWPVHSYELKKLIPLFLIKFLITFNYTILKDAKDTLIVTSKGSGAEAIPVLKGWVVLPCAFLAMMLYSRLSNRLSKATLFYGTIFSFLSFFALYAFVLFPLRDVLCPHQSADWLISVLGQERSHWVAVYRYWMTSLFFVASELWGGIAIGMLFWGFANQITRISEAKRFYAIFSAGGDLAVILAGPMIWYYSKSLSHLHFSVTLQTLMLYVLLSGVATIVCYWWLHQFVLNDERFLPKEEQVKIKKKRPQLSLWQSIKVLSTSPSLYSLAIMVISYGLAFNLVEVTWKAALKLKYPEPSEYQSFMGMVSFATGFISLIVTLFVGGNIIRRFGWLFSARLTPIFVCCSGLAFLFFHVFQERLEGSFLLFGFAPLSFVILLGAIQNVTGKTMKYSFFDPTKEMAFIPHDEEFKIKGKAAIDIVAARFGKSGSSWLQVLLIELIGSGSVLSITHCLAPFVCATFFLWMKSVDVLDQNLAKLNTEEQESAEKVS